MALQLKKHSFALTDTLETVVMVSVSENERLPAELIIKQGESPKLKFEYHEFSKVCSIRKAISKYNKTICSNTQMSFQLSEFYPEDFEIEAENRKISTALSFQPTFHPEYVLLGSPETDKFEGFEVLYSSFSEWFSDSSGFEPDNEKNLKYKISQRSFEVEVRTETKKKVKISSRTNYKSKSNGRISSIEEYSPINVEVLGGETISVVEVKKMIIEIRKLIQLLLGFPISVEHVWCISKDKRYPLYYTNFESTTNIVEHFRDTSVHPSMLEEDNNWEMIFRNYYNNYEIFKNVWGNMVGLANYNGIWTFKLLGYFGVFDACVTKHCGSDMKRQHFSKRYEKLKEDKLKDIQKIIGFTPEEYNELYKLRNKIAHGTPPVKADITYEIQLQDKLFLILTYLIYRDLGLTSQFFLRCLNDSFQKAFKNARINYVELHRATGTQFFTVSKKDYEMITSWQYYVLEKSGELFAINYELSDLAINTEIISNVEVDINKSFEKIGKTIEFIENAYLIEAKTKHEKNVQAICIILPAH